MAEDAPETLVFAASAAYLAAMRFRVGGFDSSSGARRPGARRRGWLPAALVGCGIGVGLLVCGLVALRLDWPLARIATAGSSLARVELAPFGEHVARGAVVLRSGRWVKVSFQNGVVEPSRRLPAGSRVKLEVTVRRAGWLGWLVGATERVSSPLQTPAARLTARLVYPQAGGEVKVKFSAPVAALSLRLGSKPQRLVRILPARRIVPLGIVASGATSAGTALVSAAPRLWERPPAAVSVSWFPAEPAPALLPRPLPNRTLDPTSPIVLDFSRPIALLLGSQRPTIYPATTGSWHEPNNHTLVFQPSGIGFPLGARIHLGLRRGFRLLDGASPKDVRTLSWHVPAGSPLRLTQLLAQLGYLPLTFHPSGGRVPLDSGAQVQAALSPPRGGFSWRYRVPAALRALWASPAERSVVVNGAVMAFESANNLDPVGESNPVLWSTLLTARLEGKTNSNGYSYVYVSENLPETLTLWHNGRVIQTTPANTGIPERPTTIGTFPVYAHLTSTTMTGTNPDGTPYSDPDVPWVNYFYDGEAVHGFVRPGYGYPQSLGCVELPIPTAAAVFPYIQIGTLVTVTT